ncbi:MAG: metal ABC transporter substrate-binding protein [Myxococcota bacterium]
MLLGALMTPAAAQAELRVVTTTNDLGYVVKAIGGDAVAVDTICKGAQDPHFVQAKPSFMVTLSRANLVVAVGLELEVGWLPTLIQGARNPEVNPGHKGYYEAGSAITPIDVPSGAIDRSKGDLHPFGNPHFWLDPENLKAAAKGIAARMGELDPDHQKLFDQNLAAFLGRLEKAEARWTAEMARFRGTKIVTYHATFNYFYRRFGLEALGYVEEKPGIPAGASHLAGLIRQMQAAHVQVLFHENYYDEATSKLVAERAGAHLIVLPTSVGGAAGVDSYEALMDSIVGTFVKAMGETRGS